MSTGEVLRVRAAMKPIATVPARAAHHRHRHRRGGRRPPPALRRVRRPGRRGGRRGHGGAGAGRRGAGEVRRRLGGRDPAQLASLPRRRRRARAAGRPRPLTRRTAADAARLSCWSARPARASRPSARCSPSGSGVPFADVDAVIEARAGKRVAEIFADDGEPCSARSRVDDRRAARRPGRARRWAAGRCCPPATRAALAGRPVVWLQVGHRARRPAGRAERGPPAAARQRPRPPGQAARPSAPRSTPRSRPGQRRHRRADPRAGRRRVEALSWPWLTASRPDGGRPGSRSSRPSARTRCVVGHGVLGRRRRRCSARRRAGRADAPADAHRRSPSGSRADARARPGHEVVRIDVPDAEAAKTAEVAARCWSVARATPASPARDAVVGIGGGATTDLAGFVAATWLRGVRAGHRADQRCWAWSTPPSAARPGINTAEGKNLVGAFYEPVGVVCDLDVLATLPPADLRAGLAEVVKCGFIADPEILTWSRSSRRAALDPASDVLRELVERSVAVKAAGRLGRPARGDLGGPPGRPRAAQLRPHPRPRRSSGASTSAGGTARRSASGWSSSPSWPAPPGCSTTRSPTGTGRVLGCARPAHRVRARRLRRPARRHGAWTRRPAARRCGSSCSNGLAQRRDPRRARPRSCSAPRTPPLPDRRG